MSTRKTFSLLIILFLAFLILFILFNNHISKDKNTINFSYAEGTVVDLDSKQVLADAVINYNSSGSNKTYTVKLDGSGKFKINHLKLGYYDWQINVPNYKTAIYKNYPVVSGGVTFYFEISKNLSIEKSYSDDESQ